MENKYILLIEDNSDDELFALMAFKKMNLAEEVKVVRDGQEALDFIFGKGKYARRDIYHQPQFILLDLKLPKVDGHKVLEQIRQNEITKNIPVVVLSSSQEEKDIHSSYLNKTNSYVVKSLDPSKFLTGIQAIAQYWLNLNKAAEPIR